MKVICVKNPRNKYAITVGYDYEVISFEGGKYKVKNDKGIIWRFNQWLFKTESEIRSKLRNDRLVSILAEK
jgi:hypothetical protein